MEEKIVPALHNTVTFMPTASWGKIHPEKQLKTACLFLQCQQSSFQ
jgi:hypothetical protein